MFLHFERSARSVSVQMFCPRLKMPSSVNSFDLKGVNGAMSGVER